MFGKKKHEHKNRSEETSTLSDQQQVSLTFQQMEKNLPEKKKRGQEQTTG